MNSKHADSSKVFSWEECQCAQRPSRDYMVDTNRIMREKNNLISELEDIVSNYQQQIDLIRIELLKRPLLPTIRDYVVVGSDSILNEDFTCHKCQNKFTIHQAEEFLKLMDYYKYQFDTVL